MQANLEITRNVRGVLAREGWTHARAAEAMGMSSMTFSRRMSGKYSFTVAELQTLADALGVTYSSLVEIPERRNQ